MKVTVIPFVTWRAHYSQQSIDTKTGGRGYKRTSRNYLNVNIIKFSQYTKKSLGFLWRLAVTQTPVDNHRLTQTWNILYAIRTNHIKASIDKTQQNSKSRLCGDRDETINNISECSKLAQKEYKARHDWVGKVMHWEICKKFKFDHTNKWYMHKPAPVLENDTHKLLWDFNIQTDHLIPARRPDLIIINKKKRICKIVDFAVQNKSEGMCEEGLSTSTLLENWKGCGTWMWWLYQL